MSSMLVFPFPFLFYGQRVRKFWVSADGFVSLPSSPLLHANSRARSQYIAPLMAQYEPR